MWLLNTKTLELREFFDRGRPSYAILSHTWGGEEVSLVEFQEFRNSDVVFSGFSGMRHLKPDLTFDTYLDCDSRKAQMDIPLIDGRSSGHEHWRIVSRSGFKKIQESCRVARDHYECDWIWIDTCCIDKRSSAELSKLLILCSDGIRKQMYVLLTCLMLLVGTLQKMSGL